MLCDDDADLSLELLNSTTPSKKRTQGNEETTVHMPRRARRHALGPHCSDIVSEFAQSLDLPAITDMGIIIKPLASSSNTGKLFEHLERQADRFIESNGGQRMAVMKFGICAGVNLEQRWRSYLQVNFRSMLVLHVSENLTLIECCEAFTIRLYGDLPGCRNIVKGGESMRQRNGAARFGPPYVIYCVASRADIGAAIGS